MLFYYVNRLLIRYSNAIFSGVLRTPACRSTPGARVVIYSVLGQSAVRPYLLAVKSFLRYLDYDVEVVVQDDGTLDRPSRIELESHVHGITIVRLEDTVTFLRDALGDTVGQTVADAQFFVPLKLANPILRFGGRFVVLLDSDVLCVRRPAFVLDCMAGTTGRTFYTDGGNSLRVAFEEVGLGGDVVKVANFNAGFFGFSNSLSCGELSEVLRKATAAIPGVEKHWQCEQACWAVLLNQTHSPVCLASIDEHYVCTGWSGYANLRNDAVLIHFVGSTRFRNLMYIRFGYAVIRALREDGTCRTLD